MDIKATNATPKNIIFMNNNYWYLHGACMCVYITLF